MKVDIKTNEHTFYKEISYGGYHGTYTSELIQDLNAVHGLDAFELFCVAVENLKLGNSKFVAKVYYRPPVGIYRVVFCEIQSIEQELKLHFFVENRG